MPESISDISLYKKLIDKKTKVLDFDNLEIASFFSKLVFETDNAKIKEFYNKLDNENRVYFVKQINGYFVHLKNKFKYAGFIPQQITDAQNRFNDILKGINE